MFADLAHRGLAYSASASEIVEILRGGVKAGIHKDLTEEQLDAQAGAASEAVKFATEQMERGFPYLYGLLAIRLWTILEDQIDGIVLSRLADRSLLKKFPALETLSVPLIQFLSTSDGSLEELILDALKQNTKSRLKVGIGRFETLLDAVGLGGAFPESVRKAILELSEVRNVLIHRDGICDARIIERCPWLGLSVRDRVVVTHEMYDIYARLPAWITIACHLRAGLVETPDYAKTSLARIEQKLDGIFAKRAKVLVSQMPSQQN